MDETEEMSEREWEAQALEYERQCQDEELHDKQDDCPWCCGDCYDENFITCKHCKGSGRASDCDVF